MARVSKHSALRDVVSLGSAKEAALYFERVFPFDYAQSLIAHVNGIEVPDPDAVPFHDGKWDEAVLKSILPQDENPLRTYLDYSLLAMIHRTVAACVVNPGYAEELLDNPGFSMMARHFRSRGFDASKMMRAIRAGSFSESKFELQLAKRTVEILKASGFEGASIWSPHAPVTASDGQSDSEVGTRFMVSLRALKLVDPHKLSWPLLVEFRKDEESRAALRDLRLFFAEEFSGKETDYISDKLSALVDRQERVARLWGFDTIRKTLGVAISQESVLASSMSSLATTALGASLPTAAAAAAVVSLGSCVLEFGRVYVDSAKERIDRPTRYLSHLRKLNS